MQAACITMARRFGRCCLILMALMSSRLLLEMNRLIHAMEGSVYMVYEAGEHNARQNVLDENNVMNILEHP